MTGAREDTLATAAAWLADGNGVALATVVQTWGSSPRPVGSHLAVRDDGRFAGSVSGGCIETEVMLEARAAIRDGNPRLLEFGVSNEQAWEVGLACGGRVRVQVQNLADAAWLVPTQAARVARRPVAVITRLADGMQWLCESGSCDGTLQTTAEVDDEVAERLTSGRSGPLATDAGLFVRVYAPDARLQIVGAVHIAQVLAPMASRAGFDVAVIDPRSTFASRERFPDVTLTTDRPDEALARCEPDAATAVVTLSHEPRLDDPALIAALSSPAFYIGALGSRRTHAARLERLGQAGFDTNALARIHGPVGLDLGGRLPAEIAVAVLAQLIQARYRPS